MFAGGQLASLWCGSAPALETSATVPDIGLGPLVQAGSGGAWLRLVIPLAGLLAFVVIGFLVIAWVRRRVADGASSEPDGFTLDGIRRLHADGQITDEEFEAARAAIIARVRGGTSENTGALPSQSD